MSTHFHLITRVNPEYFTIVLVSTSEYNFVNTGFFYTSIPLCHKKIMCPLYLQLSWFCTKVSNQIMQTIHINVLNQMKSCRHTMYFIQWKQYAPEPQILGAYKCDIKLHVLRKIECPKVIHVHEHACTCSLQISRLKFKSLP